MSKQHTETAGQLCACHNGSGCYGPFPAVLVCQGTKCIFEDFPPKCPWAEERTGRVGLVCASRKWAQYVLPFSFNPGSSSMFSVVMLMTI